MIDTLKCHCSSILTFIECCSRRAALKASILEHCSTGYAYDIAARKIWEGPGIDLVSLVRLTLSSTISRAGSAAFKCTELQDPGCGPDASCRL